MMPKQAPRTEACLAGWSGSLCQAAACAFTISVFLCMARSSLRLHRTIKLRVARPDADVLVQHKLPRVALVTMADSRYLNCTLHLARGARDAGWRSPIFLLLIGGTAHDAATVRAIEDLGVHLIHTAPALDAWVDNGNVSRRYHYRRLSAAKFRKMEIFFNPVFRTFDRVIYMDPDGLIGAPLAPLALMTFPPNTTVLMRQNDASVGKPSLWRAEIAPDALLAPQRAQLEAAYPDRAMVGGSCWFMVQTGRLPPPPRILADSRRLLCRYKAAFRLNDQTLLNLLFYDALDLFPWCASRELRVIGASPRLRAYCRAHMDDQRWADGGLAFMYRHHSPAEKRQCLGGAGAGEGAAGERSFPVPEDAPPADCAALEAGGAG
jgi:hypothetical protein